MIDPISGSADLRMPLVIGAIGHRDPVDDEVELLETRVREFLGTLRQRYPELRVTLMTSLTDGADRLVAGVAKSLALPVIHVLPMRMALFERDFAGASLEEYRTLIESGGVLRLPLVAHNTEDASRIRVRHAILSTPSSAHTSPHTVTSCWPCGTAAAPDSRSALARAPSTATWRCASIASGSCDSASVRCR